MELENFINKSVIVPLSQSEIAEMQTAIDSYIEDGIDFSEYSNLTMYVLLDKTYPNFESYIKESFQKLHSKKGKFSTRLIRSMQAYAAFEVFQREDEDKLIYGLIVLNHILLKHNELKQCLYQKEIKECIDSTLGLLKKNCIAVDTDCSDVYDSILSNSLSIDINSLEEEERDKYYSLAVKGWLFDLDKWVHDNKYSNQAKLDLTFQLFEWIFDNKPSVSMDCLDIPIVKLLTELGLNDKDSLPVSDYITKLSDSDMDGTIQDALFPILDDKSLPNGVKDYLMEIRLTELEFAIYLFYELYLNKLLEDYGEGED